MKKTCPLCGLEKKQERFYTPTGVDRGALYYCGTAYSSKQKRIVITGVACLEIQRLQQKLKERDPRRAVE